MINAIHNRIKLIKRSLVSLFGINAVPQDVSKLQGPREARLKKLMIETTRRCNLKCIQCASTEENNLGSFHPET